MGDYILQHLGHQHQRALLDPLGAEQDRLAGAGVGRQVSQRGAQVLGGNHGQQQVEAGQIGQVSGRGRLRREAHPRQEQRIFVGAIDCGGDLGLARPQPHIEPGPHADLGQGRAPGARADHAR